MLRPQTLGVPLGDPYLHHLPCSCCQSTRPSSASFLLRVRFRIVRDPDAWWFAGDQKDLRVCTKEVVPSPTGDGYLLMGGILRPGHLLPVLCRLLSRIMAYLQPASFGNS